LFVMLFFYIRVHEGVIRVNFSFSKGWWIYDIFRTHFLCYHHNFIDIFVFVFYI
jgi:hypothetical protein